MASPAYVWLIDNQGNHILSDSRVTGREKSIEALAFEYCVNIPTDKFTGSTTGTRQHMTVQLTKSYCPASPILFDACCHGKTLKQMIIKWYRISKHGKEEEYFTHLLDDVKVVSYQQTLAHVKETKHDKYTHQDQIEFRFAKITLKHHDGNIEASDEWINRS